MREGGEGEGDGGREREGETGGGEDTQLKNQCTLSKCVVLFSFLLAWSNPSAHFTTHTGSCHSCWLFDSTTRETGMTWFSTGTSRWLFDSTTRQTGMTWFSTGTSRWSGIGNCLDLGGTLCCRKAQKFPYACTCTCVCLLLKMAGSWCNRISTFLACNHIHRIPQYHICSVYYTLVLKSIRVHLSPGSTCGLVAYTLRILTQRYTFILVGIQA